MTDQHDVSEEQEIDTARASVKRRGLIAGAAALVTTALLSKANTENVAASGNGTPVLLGADSGGSGAYQFASATTWIATPAMATPGFRSTNGFSDVPDAKGDGVQGITVNFPVGPPATVNAGVFGRNNDLDGVGTWGEAQNGTGAFGDSVSGSGVAGSSTSGAGTYGQSTGGFGAAGVSTNGEGVYGQSSTSNGVHGLSNGAYGVVGVTTAAGFGGCTGITSTPGAAAFIGGAPVGAYAAYFTGKTVVEGDFFVVKHADGSGGGKFAAVAHADGSYRGVYCTESPEPWFEDFGTGTIHGSTAEVALDPEFAALIHTEDYHVFITEHSDQHLHVPQRTATGFHVAMTTTPGMPGASNGTAIAAGGQTFSWRVVGKRKDIAGTRLPKVDLPKLHALDPDKLPKSLPPHKP